MKKFDFEVLGMGSNYRADFSGTFTPVVKYIIQSVIYGRVLHLYSGTSLLGDVRVDLRRPEATDNITVEEFIVNDDNFFDWVILDPPYKIANTTILKGYAEKDSLWGYPLRQKALEKYFAKHTDNVLWLDFCAPIFKPFRRQKLWLLLPGGYHTVRVLSWLKREMKPLF